MGSSTLDKLRKYGGYGLGALGALVGEAVGGTPASIAFGLAGSAAGAAIQPGNRQQKLKGGLISAGGAAVVAGGAAIAKTAGGQSLSDPISFTKLFAPSPKYSTPGQTLPDGRRIDQNGRIELGPGTGMVTGPQGTPIQGVWGGSGAPGAGDNPILSLAGGAAKALAGAAGGGSGSGVPGVQDDGMIGAYGVELPPGYFNPYGMGVQGADMAGVEFQGAGAGAGGAGDPLEGVKRFVATPVGAALAVVAAWYVFGKGA